MRGLSRRALLRAGAVLPLAWVARSAAARDYASAAEVLGEIDRLEGEVDARFVVLAASSPAAAALARSVAADHVAHRRGRARVRKRLGLPAAGAARRPSPERPADLEALRTAAQDLVHAHAEGFPALRDARAVDVLVRHMVANARHLTLVDLWREDEEDDG